MGQLGNDAAKWVRGRTLPIGGYSGIGRVVLSPRDRDYSFTKLAMVGYGALATDGKQEHSGNLDQRREDNPILLQQRRIVGNCVPETAGRD